MVAEKSNYNYFNDRLEDQIKWHGKKSRDNKKKFYALQTAIIVASTLIAIINALSISDIISHYIAIISSVLGGLVVTLTAIIQLHKYQENWIMYRTTSELLKKEKYFFLNGVGSYSGLDQEEKQKILVERVETIVSSETSKYFELHQLRQISNQKSSNLK